MENTAKMLEFAQLGDERGKLVVFENKKNIPFEIRRVFYIYESDSSIVRGQHANRLSEFVLINVAGSSKVCVRDGRTEKVFTLDHAHMGVYIPKMLWKDMYDFSKDSVLLVLASELYDPNEYIRDYDTYLEELSAIGSNLQASYLISDKAEV